MNIQFRFKKALLLITVANFIAVSVSTLTMAHVVVKPNQVATASYQVFTVSVPNEKDTATVEVKLLVPSHLTNVTPTKKSGWKITTQTKGSNDQEAVTAIVWKGGEIGKGLRDDFTFSAKTPSSPTKLKWKAYQTYDDGTVVSWDQSEESASHDNGTAGPFSVTDVRNSNATDALTDSTIHNLEARADRAVYIGFAGIAIGLIAIFFATRKK